MEESYVFNLLELKAVLVILKFFKNQSEGVDIEQKITELIDGLVFKTERLIHRIESGEPV